MQQVNRCLTFSRQFQSIPSYHPYHKIIKILNFTHIIELSAQNHSMETTNNGNRFTGDDLL